MDPPGPTSFAPRPDDDEGERTQRQLIELLNELRVAMPGVQVLFAFLLAVPFQARFGLVSDTERALYALALLSAGAASACFIASTAAHRLLFHRHQREYVIMVGSRLLIAGLVGLAISMSCSAALVTSFIYSSAAGWAALGSTAVLLTGMWFVMPLLRREALDRARDAA